MSHSHQTNRISNLPETVLTDLKIGILPLRENEDDLIDYFRKFDEESRIRILDFFNKIMGFNFPKEEGQISLGGFQIILKSRKGIYDDGGIKIWQE